MKAGIEGLRRRWKAARALPGESEKPRSQNTRCGVARAASSGNENAKFQQVKQRLRDVMGLLTCMKPVRVCLTGSAMVHSYRLTERT